jgi:hypothetical protein
MFFPGFKKFGFSQLIFKKSPIKKISKIRPVALICADRRTDMTRQVRHFVDHANTNTKTVVMQNIVI